MNLPFHFQNLGMKKSVVAILAGVGILVAGAGISGAVDQVKSGNVGIKGQTGINEVHGRGNDHFRDNGGFRGHGHRGGCGVGNYEQTVSSKKETKTEKKTFSQNVSGFFGGMAKTVKGWFGGSKGTTGKASDTTNSDSKESKSQEQQGDDHMKFNGGNQNFHQNRNWNFH